jgi:hypothetical protein
MATRKALLIIGFGAIFTSAAFGGAPMGPAIALLGEGNWGVGAEYGHESIDLQAHGELTMIYNNVPFEFIESQRIDSLEMNMFFATMAYGLCDTWDVFVRVGGADAQDGITGTANIPRDITDVGGDLGVPQGYTIGDFSGSYGVAWGGGTRATFCQSGPWSFGGLVQATWFQPADSDVEYIDPLQGSDAIQIGKASLDFWEAQVAVAAVYQVDTVRVWAGPFLQFFNGDLDRDGGIQISGFTGSFDASSDIKEQSQLGGYLGAQYEPSQQVNLWVEGQFTGDSWFVGVGLLYKPVESYGM